MSFLSRLKRFFSPEDPIKHVVVLMFENHSFDQMLGCFRSVYSNLDGIDPAQLKFNQDSTDQKYYQRHANDTVVNPDPMHELSHVLNQLKNNNGGFVSEYETEYKNSPTPTTSDQRQRIMDYFEVGDLPVLHELAKHFTICDHWYSSVPGPTWTNRFFVHSGTAKGMVTMPKNLLDKKYYEHYDQDTIYDRLNTAKRKWRIYYGDFPQSLILMHQRHPINAICYRPMLSFYFDLIHGGLPEYSFIEPNYSKLGQNDDHPPFSTIRAQRLLGRVYNALRNSSAWDSTLLIVLYDEHGGFFDHEIPPEAVPPDEHQEEYTFDQYGVRVPALLISPWVEKTVVSTKFDHTSVLRYLTDKWGLGPALTNRVASANSFAGVISMNKRADNDTPISVEIPSLPQQMIAAVAAGSLSPEMSAEELAEPDNDLQRSLKIFAEHLAQNELPADIHPRMLTTVGPLAEDYHAQQQIQAFLEKQRSLAEV